MTGELGEAVGAAAWDAGLPRKRMAACVMLFDEFERLLVVDPIYKPYWDLPGGVVELGESPRAAARREMLEELGLDRVPGRLVGVDWVPDRASRSEGLIVVFDGGVLSPKQVDGVRVQPEELAAFRFVTTREVGQGRSGLSPLLGRRAAACLEAVRAQSVVYLENGALPLS